MESKYEISAFNYPYKRTNAYYKQTEFFIIALFWLIVYICKYDGVNLNVRK